MKISSGGSSSDSCKDVDVVTVLPECSISIAADSMNPHMVADCRSKDQSFVSSRIRSFEDSSLNYDSVHDTVSVSSSGFEFQKTERAPQRVPIVPFSKPMPSKWDDAQKWIASPSSSRTGQTHLQGGQGVGSRKVGSVAYLSRQSSTKVVVEVPAQKVVAFEEPETKRVDSNQAKKETGVQKFVGWEADPYPIADSYGKPVLMIENSVMESASKEKLFLIFIHMINCLLAVILIVEVFIRASCNVEIYFVLSFFTFQHCFHIIIMITFSVSSFFKIEEEFIDGKQ